MLVDFLNSVDGVSGFMNSLIYFAELTFSQSLQNLEIQNRGLPCSKVTKIVFIPPQTNLLDIFRILPSQRLTKTITTHPRTQTHIFPFHIFSSNYRILERIMAKNGWHSYFRLTLAVG